MLGYFRKVLGATRSTGQVRMPNQPDTGIASRFPWRRLTVEGVVIVVSILLAFAIDAAWQERQERQDELEALEQLSETLAQFDDVLKEWRSEHTAVAEAAQTLLRLTGSAAELRLDADRIGTLLARVTWAWTIDLADVTLSDLMSSGQLNLLQDPSIRDALGSWRAVMADVQDDERTAEVLLHRDLMPYLTQRASWRTIHHLDQNAIYAGPVPVRKSSYENGLSGLLTDREFENLIELRWAYSQNLVNNYDLARDRLEVLRQLIRKASKP
jgi:hypothetical protein